MTRTRNSAPLIMVSLIAVAAGCGPSGEADRLPSPAGAPASTTTTEAAPESTATDTTEPAPSTATATTEVTGTTEELPGEPLDPIYTPAGAELAAVAVGFDETLEVRALPDATAPVLVSLAPTATGIVSTGRARLNDGAWLEVTADGSVGWVPLAHLLYLGPTDDATDRVVAGLGAAPTAPSVVELGRIVADWFASDDEEVPSRVVVVVAPTEGEVAEVTYDVVGFPDDSIGGVRLRVVGRRITADLPPTAFGTAVAYELVTVESTALCLRGGSPDDLCV